MFLRIAIAFAILGPFLVLSREARPWWQTLIAAAVAFGLGHLADRYLARRRGQEGQRRTESRGVKIASSAAIVVASLGMLIYSSTADAEYYRHVHEVMKEPAAWVGRSFKMHGHVEAGSIREEIIGQKTHRTFVLEAEGHRVLVRSEGPKPDTFKDLAEVVATGRMLKEGDLYVFNAVDLSAKCPSKYEENQRSTRAAPIGAIEAR